MSRQRLGWSMVLLAGVLLLAQLAPALASNRASPRKAVSGPELRLRHGPVPLGGEFRSLRLDPTEEGLLVDRAGRGTAFEVVGWQGTHDGSLQAPPSTARDLVAWRDLQSPDGARFVAGTQYLDIDGRVSDLTYLVEFGALTSFTWREDSQGACALSDLSVGVPTLVQFVFNPGHATDIRFQLPAEFAGNGDSAATVLWCNRAHRTAAVGIVRPDGSALVEVLDIVTGEDLGRRSYPRGTARSLVAARDGSLLAINGADLAHGGPAPSVVRNIDTDKAVLDLGPDSTVRSFSTDNSRVLVESSARPAVATRLLADGSAAWQDDTGRELLGWLARPFSSDFAVALGRRDARTCTRGGEVLKFPQFCPFEALQDLEVISGDGNILGLGRGVGAWGYTVR